MVDENKQKVIAQLREKGIDFNPNSQLKTLEALLTPGETPEEPKKEEEQKSAVNDVLASITKTLSAIDGRLAKLENKQSSEYRSDAKTEDIDKASEMKKDLDPRIVQIVEESLGTDFGIEITQFKDTPGFLFTVIVPQRLSDIPMDSRPVVDPVSKLYKKDEFGNTVFETYYPEDRRSKVIGSMQSFDVIRKHCDTVRSYIVSYYEKTKKPLPEFKIK